MVWIDRSQAKMFHDGRSGGDEIVMHPHLPRQHLRHGEIVIIGPASAKTELAKSRHEQHIKIGGSIVAGEAAHHPIDRGIVVYAQQYFRIASVRAAGGLFLG